jgi:arylsulfatase
MHLFDKGWNELRETIFANQKSLGVIPKDAKLTPWPKDLKEWDQLTAMRRRCSSLPGRHFRRVLGLLRP